MIYTAEIALEIDAATAEDAASLALLEARTTTDPFTIDVYSDNNSERGWQRVVVAIRRCRRG
jgi:hypothetical protein